MITAGFSVKDRFHRQFTRLRGAVQPSEGGHWEHHKAEKEAKRGGCRIIRDKEMRIARSIIMVVVALIITCSPQLSRAQADKLSIVFVTWEPYGFIRDGKAVGFELDIFSAVMEKMGISVDYREKPWKRCLYLVKHGEADAVISALKTPERQEYMYYPNESISVNQTALFCTSDRIIRFTGSYSDLKQYIVGVTRGFSYSEAFDKAKYLKIDQNTRTEDIVRKLVNGRIDIGIGNLVVISLVAKRMSLQHKIKFLKPLVHSSKLYVGFSKKSVAIEFVRRFSKQLMEFKGTPEYMQLLDKYGVKYASQIP